MSSYLKETIKEKFNEEISIFSYVSKSWLMDTFHIHDEFEIYLCVQDNIKFLMPDRSYNLISGDVLIFNNSDIHMSVVPNDMDYNRKILQFKPEYINQFSDSNTDLLECFLNRKPGFSHKVHLSDEDKDECLRIFSKLEELNNLRLTEGNTIKYGLNIYMRIYVVELLLLINSVYRESNMTYKNESNNCYRKLRPILQHIHENYNRELTIDYLANNFYISKPYIFSLFKKVTGYTPNEYIAKWRIAKACELLSKGDVSVKQVAEMIGYKDTSHFIRVFSQQVGTTPGSYNKATQVQ